MPGSFPVPPTFKGKALGTRLVAEIREITSPDQWSHCSGKGNPVIDASRGLNPQKLSNQLSGGEAGPDFLWETEDCWPGARRSRQRPRNAVLSKYLSV